MNGTSRLLFSAAMLLSPSLLPAAESILFVGSYTRDQKSKGVTRLKMDTETGALKLDGLAAESDSPSFLAITADGRRLYAVNEPPSAVSAWSVEPGTGNLTALNEQGVAEGERVGPCHLVLGPGDKTVTVANYGGGSVASFPLKDDGSVGPRATFVQHTGKGPNASRQEKPHAHGAHLSPDGKYVLVPDLGVDRIFVYGLDPVTGALLPGKSEGGAAPAGSGPRHGVFHPSKPLFFCINELDSTITSYQWNAADATLKTGASVSTLPEDFKGSSSTAEIAAHPNGKFVYGSNRGHDSIAVFKITDMEKGTLSQVQVEPIGGKTPRHFTLDPSGRWLLAAGQDSDDIRVFSVDSATGKLKATEHSVSVGSPVCVVFAPVEK